MNSFINYLEGWNQEMEFYKQLWVGIKRDWLNPQVGRQLYLDDDENILTVQLGNEVAIVGFLYFKRQVYDVLNFESFLTYQSNEFIRELETLRKKNHWIGKIVFITTYRLSSFSKLDVAALSPNASYFYLINSIKEQNPVCQLQLDKSIQDYKEGNIVLNEFFQIDEQRKSLRKRWSCFICDGDNETGCLYFDPSQCPKFK